MQFVANGPDIPDALLHDHEEGRVVFFCGAGISIPAGLDTFGPLVTKMYADVRHSPDSVQRTAIERQQYDIAVGLLESAVVGGRHCVRQSLVRMLTPDLARPNALTTHEALLALGRTRQGALRIVTTNFDRLFEMVCARQSILPNSYYAPHLPIPKRQWNGLVYLHGLIPEPALPEKLDSLVLTSGDFGLAYLTERWAARFVCELFRNFTVCFVGYSLSDPVLRYLMDALAADRTRGERIHDVYAFASFASGSSDATRDEWQAKNVTAILYDDRDHHQLLHATITRWANTYRDGITGKERIVVESAAFRPAIVTRDDDVVGRMRWALSDPSGGPAKRFSEIIPAPSLEWLEPLAQACFTQGDLERFGICPMEGDPAKSFSLMARPAPYHRTPMMAVCGDGEASVPFDDVMSHLVEWLCHFLDDPALALWIAQRGGAMHPSFAARVEQRLGHYSRLEHEVPPTNLDRVRAERPQAVPGPLMRVLWRLLLTRRVTTKRHSLRGHFCCQRFRREGYSGSFRMELRDALTPCVLLREAFGSVALEPSTRAEQMSDLVRWEIVLAADGIAESLRDLTGLPEWRPTLERILPDVLLLLRDALDLQRDLGAASDTSDASHVVRPSISDHQQNREPNDWTVLITLARDGWAVIADSDPDRARLIALTWWSIPYPLFKRLAMHAAASSQVFRPHEVVNLLLSDQQWWLWSDEVQRELVELLVSLVPRLIDEDRKRLDEAIDLGPPSALYPYEFTPDEWIRKQDRQVWIRLSKLDATQIELGERSRNRMRRLKETYPTWLRTPGDRADFSNWWGAGSELFTQVHIPTNAEELAHWLQQNPASQPGHEDDWQQRCRDDVQTTFSALSTLADQGDWPEVRWHEALIAWSRDGQQAQTWSFAAPVLNRAPDALLLSITWWLRDIAAHLTDYEGLLLAMAQRILDHQPDSIYEGIRPVQDSLNHPVGQIVEALIDRWFVSKPGDGQRIPEAYLNLFDRVCDRSVRWRRAGRVILAVHLVSLYRVDPGWTTRTVLPMLSWTSSRAEAVAAWSGFLWSPRRHPRLFQAFKQDFLDTAKHFIDFEEYAEQYAIILTYEALEMDGVFTPDELRLALAALPPGGVREVAQTLAQAVTAAGEQCESYWEHRVIPFWDTMWPTARTLKTMEVSRALAHLCLATRAAFPSAVDRIRTWLQPPWHVSPLIARLTTAGHCTNHPQAALTFLDCIIGDRPDQYLGSEELATCLSAMEVADPTIANDHRFQRLRTRAHRG